MRLGVWALWAALLSPGLAEAAIDTYGFADEAQRARFSVLTQELRCPKCQNQDLADSNAPIAADLRREIHRLLLQGQSDAQIVDYLVARYGEYVRYKPRFEARTWLLWLGPVGFLLAAGGLAWALLRQRSSSQAPVALSENEKARLNQLLKGGEDA